MLSPQKKEELKKNWFKAHKPLEDAMPGITEPVCNWWLSVIDQLLGEKTKEIDDLSGALLDMYGQYCDDGHSFMSAGERASSVLEQYGYADFGESGKLITILKQ